MNSKDFLSKITILFSLVFLNSCAEFRPYRLMAEAAKSPERPMAFADDERLKLRLHEAMLVAVPESTLAISSYVFQSCAYLVGWVQDDAQRAALIAAAQNVSGIRYVTDFLPLKVAETRQKVSQKVSTIELWRKLFKYFLTSFEFFFEY